LRTRIRGQGSEIRGQSAILKTGIEFFTYATATSPIAKRGIAMNKKSRMERAKEIISSVKREMDKPRLTASVRNGERRLSLRAARAPAASVLRP
jgi:hypothetical protein